jgi:hypothetical protein
MMENARRIAPPSVIRRSGPSHSCHCRQSESESARTEARFRPSPKPALPQGAKDGQEEGQPGSSMTTARPWRRMPSALAAPSDRSIILCLLASLSVMVTMISRPES